MMGQIFVDPGISTMRVVSNNIINTRIDLSPECQGNKRVRIRSGRTKGITWIT